MSETTEKVAPKIKHDWYQTESQVIVTVLLKNSEEDKVQVGYDSRSLSVTCPIPNSEFIYKLEILLAHEIDPKACTHRVVPSKIEIKLKKNEPGQWLALEGAEEEKNKAFEPKYPSSSRNQKNWQELEKEVEKQDAEERKGQEALTELFKKIYGEGSDDVRRAMNKSFVESGGTVLSTNWKEVSEKNVPVKPPEGLEYKKWDN